MSGDDLGGFAPPPFSPADAQQTLRRELRALGLSEREGRFERQGQVIARIESPAGSERAGEALQVARVKRPSRTTPEWQSRELRNGADVRNFVADLKKQLALWSDRDD